MKEQTSLGDFEDLNNRMVGGLDAIWKIISIQEMLSTLQAIGHVYSTFNAALNLQDLLIVILFYSQSKLLVNY